MTNLNVLYPTWRKTTTTQTTTITTTTTTVTIALEGEACQPATVSIVCVVTFLKRKIRFLAPQILQTF